jgi:F-type H+-transporting ATPase subunit gamma
MAERPADIAAQIQNVRQLQAVVTAMRGIAASRTQQSRSLLAGIEAYSGVISRAVGQALRLLPSDGRAQPAARAAKPGLVLFCAEQGFAGAFSERIFEAAGRDLDGTVNFLIGTRGAALAHEGAIRVAWSAPMATNVAGIPGLADRITEALYRRIASGVVAEIDLVFPRSVPPGIIQIDRHSLLPVDLGRFAAPSRGDPPLTTLAPRHLVERLAEEYVYAQLCEAAMHAFEAENEARMMAMAAAKTNIEMKLDGLSQRERQLRQEEITAEVVELAAGTEALKTRPR